MTTASSSGVVASTKLHIPVPRRGIVRRRELVVALLTGAARRMVLVDAPPGFGKTTLIAEWASSSEEERPFAWLSLDEDDGDPVRFWSGVIDALRTVDPGLGGPAREALEGGAPLREAVLPSIVNDLAALEGRLVLVLDDYHVITSTAVQETMTLFIDHLPPTVQLVISTRSDPPLPLARLRARDELTEVRAAQLRFTDAETADLLNRVLGLGLAPGDLARLHVRTEGWAAGLYLAALSLRGRANAAEFIRSFAGDDRQIVDYLSTEVLARQPDDVREFLVRTSVLRRLNGPLCDAVTGSEGSARMLERMERWNLFLVPLDSRRAWYRYHLLFAGLLRHELRLTEPELVSELHRRAAAWYRDEGIVPEAIHHATAGEDVEGARELISAHWNEFFNRGRHETVSAWLNALPAEAVRRDPELCVARAWLAMDAGKVEEAGRSIGDAQAAIDASGGDGGSAAADTALLRAVQRFKAGDLADARGAAERTLELDPEGASFARAVAHAIVGITHHWRGDHRGARAPLEEGARLARAGGNDLGHAYALGYLALGRAESGQLDEAERLGREALGARDDPGFTEHFVPTIGHLALALVHERRGQVEDAERSAERAVLLSSRGAGALEVAAARLALAGLRQLRGERAEAGALLGEAGDALARCPDPGTLPHALEVAERALSAPARGGPARGGASDELTERELAVLRLLPSGLSQREIGAALYVSFNTVKTHSRAIFRKLGASTRDDAVERARRLGLL